MQRLTLLFLLLYASPAAAAGPVYLIPVQGEISPGLIHPFRRGLREAREQGAAAVILLMDTPGGRVDATMEIIDLLDDAGLPTLTLVDHWALSAGAFIAVATDRIYMTSRAVIGAATPVLSSPAGGGAEMPAAVEEKMTSALAATIEAAAAARGHPTELVRAMVDRDVEIPDPERPGEFITKAGKLLTLTASRAEELGLSAGTVGGLEEMLAKAGFAEARVIRLKLSPAEKAARFLTSSTVTMILLLGGMAGIYLEFKTPGFGLPGIAGISCLALFFFGQYVGGAAGYEEIILFALGAGLLAVEIFVTPGFGLLGFSGIVLAGAALVMAMSRGPLFLPGFALNPDYPRALANFGSAAVGFGILALLSARLLRNRGGILSRRLVLESSEEGFRSGALSPDTGARGVAVTQLRPAGKARFGGKTVDVVSRGELVPAGTAVEVAEVSGNRVVVRPLA